MKLNKNIHELSFEEAADRGLHRPKDGELISRITVNRYPRHLAAGTLSIKDKHSNLSTLSNVLCVATALGATIIQQNEALREIERIKKQCASSLDANEFMSTFQDYHYDFGPQFKNLYTSKTSIPVLPWVEGIISEIHNILGLSRPTVTIIALTTGLSRSESLLHPSLRKMYQKETGSFFPWIENQLRRLRDSRSYSGDNQ